MSGRLQGRVAVVTGGAAGIGRAVALRFAEEGAAVAVVDVDALGARKVASTIEGAGGAAASFEVDVTDWGAVAATFAAIDAKVGATDVLVNCAGGSRADDGPTDVLTLAASQATWALDVGGTMACVQAVVPRMRARGGGSIVNLSSFVALDGSSLDHAYVAAKGAIASLTRALAGTYGPDQIRVNAVAPGIVLTDRVQERLHRDDVDLLSIQRTHPFAVTQPEDLAAVALFLASHESSAVTGAVLAADGGLSTF